uniref:hypothetical protein n=1 Tax=Ulva meridionalis TaxID=434723 RepID=UPI0021144E95|nr:hypothetical protein NQY40_mgp04 [Ulva meridionalis]UTA96490.1 hypothetical protein [Ulva meridionalis]UTA96550.1 hypothetical protein [Ulva meridionalis]UTA96608.1 hypothetical protein [Ulva meridionalis]UTA96660.1 hypothetical protein [Ulva meridionalis]UTA96712.1 hypothetical protein [Ulva meridionalis]
MSVIYKQPEMFGFYIAGLFEGDGHIVMPTMLNKHNPRWHITFHITNKPLAQKLLSKIESGFIRYKIKSNACVLTVSAVKGLKLIVTLTNGKLRTPKISQMYLLIDWLNKHHGAQINKLPINTNSVSEDPWLAGFIDADGSFGIRYTKKLPGRKRRVSCRFRLEQRMSDPKTNQSYRNVLTLIANYLCTRLSTRIQRSTGKTYYKIEVSSLVGIVILINYLNNYTLLTAKLLDYNDWYKVAQHVINKTHYTENGLDEIAAIKDAINRNRSLFNWDHLNRF